MPKIIPHIPCRYWQVSVISLPLLPISCLYFLRGIFKIRYVTDTTPLSTNTATTMQNITNKIPSASEIRTCSKQECLLCIGYDYKLYCRKARLYLLRMVYEPKQFSHALNAV